MGRRIESKPVSLIRKILGFIKQNNPKQNYSSPPNSKYKPNGLIVANNNVYGT